MNLLKPKFWEKKSSILSLVLLPASIVVICFTYLKKRLTKEIAYKIPIVCVGNLYLGGTGKTPLTILIGNELSKKGKNPAIVRKFYKNHNDEHQLLSKYYKNSILNKNRKDGIGEAIKMGFDTIILDDGFQDYKIKKNFNIICFNNNQLIGNGHVIPAGPMRENLSAVKNADVVLINGNKNDNFEKKVFKYNRNIDIFYSRYEFINFKEFENEKLLAFAGIGNPENFFKLIYNKGLNLEIRQSFPDHYNLRNSEIEKIIYKANQNNCKIITTEKDYYRLNNNYRNKIEYAKIELKIENKDKLIDKILSIYD